MGWNMPIMSGSNGGQNAPFSGADRISWESVQRYGRIEMFW